jgi:hypothetical protein
LFQRQPDVRLRLDRVHVEHLGVGATFAHRRDFARRRDVEGVDAGLDQRLQHHRLAIGLHRIGGLAGKHPMNRRASAFSTSGPEAVDRIVRPHGERGGPRILESLQSSSASPSPAPRSISISPRGASPSPSPCPTLPASCFWPCSTTSSPSR